MKSDVDMPFLVSWEAVTRAHRGEVSGRNDIDTDVKAAADELGRHHAREVRRRRLGGVVRELAALRGIRDAADRGNVDDVSRLGGAADLPRRSEEGEEGERGEVHTRHVDAVRLVPDVSSLMPWERTRSRKSRPRARPLRDPRPSGGHPSGRCQRGTRRGLLSASTGSE